MDTEAEIEELLLFTNLVFATDLYFMNYGVLPFKALIVFTCVSMN